MLTFNKDIYKEIVKPVGIKYYVPTSENGKKYKVAKNIPEVWDFLFPIQIRTLMPIKKRLTAMNQGVFSENDGYPRYRADIKSSLRGMNNQCYNYVEDHLKNIIRINAAISVYIKETERDLKIHELSGTQLDRFVNDNESQIEDENKIFLNNISQNILLQKAKINSDTRITDEFKKYILDNAEEDPVKILGILCILSLFEEDDDDKDFYGDVYSHYIIPGHIPENEFIKVDFESRLETPIYPGYHGRNDLFEYIIQNYNNTNDRKSAICIWGNIGEGKTSFSFHLLNRMAVNNYIGANYIYYWKFEINNMNNSTIEGINLFLSSISDFFGFDTNDESEELQIKKICDFIICHKVFLILDGVDSLLQQNVDAYTISNQTLRFLIVSMAREGNRGGNSFLLLLSNNPVSYLDNYGTSENIKIPSLSENDCILILKHYGIKGTDKLFKDTVKKLSYNPLSIVLFSINVKTHYDGQLMVGEDLCINTMLESIPEYKKNILKGILFSFKEKNSNNNSEYEWKLLSVFSLFRTSFSEDLLNLIIPKLDYLSEYNKLDSNMQRTVKEKIKNTGFISIRNESIYSVQAVIREIIFEYFKGNHLAEFQECNREIAKYYKDSYIERKDHINDILDLKPAYDVVYYLVLADEYKDAIDFLWEEIYRKREFFSQKKLGIISNDLFIVSMFFDTKNGWNVLPSVSDTDDATWLYSVAAYLFNSLGRLKDSEKLREKELAIYKQEGNYIFVAYDGLHLARNLMLQCRFRDSIKQFEELLKINLESSGIPNTNRYSATIVPEQVKSSIYIRYAFLHYLKGGENNFIKAGKLIDKCNFQETINTSMDTWYYYLITCSINSNKVRFNEFDGQIDRFYNEKIVEGSNYKIAYACFLKAFLETRKILVQTDNNVTDSIETILIVFEQARNYAEKVWRMDQYPFILIEMIDILIDLYNKTKNEKINDFIEETFNKINKVFDFCDIPLLRVLNKILRMKLAVSNNHEIAGAYREELREQTPPSTWDFFIERINSIYDGNSRGIINE